MISFKLKKKSYLALKCFQKIYMHVLSMEFKVLKSDHYQLRSFHNQVTFLLKSFQNQFKSIRDHKSQMI